MNATIEVSSATFNSATFDAASGDPKRVEFEDMLDAIDNYGPGDYYPRQSFQVPGTPPTVQLIMGEYVAITKGTTSNFAFTLRGKTSSPTRTLATMIYQGCSARQGKYGLGEWVYRFRHGDNSTGVAHPLS
jgi:hypothetical protein